MDALSNRYNSPAGKLPGLIPAIALACVLACSLLHEGAYASDTPPTGYNLVVKPSICVSYDSEMPCKMAMQVSWEGRTEADICLREMMQEPQIHCWENASRGSVDIRYPDTADLVYQLVEESSSAVLAEAQVRIINRDLRSARKRRRHVWSIL